MKWNRLIFILLYFTIVLIVFGTEGSLPITYYISSDGNDTWDGLAPSFQSGTKGPKKSLGFALPSLSQGIYYFRIHTEKQVFYHSWVKRD